jgi:hypothetical protein
MSVAMPIGAPRQAFRALSLPEEPPLLRLMLKGFKVRPKRFDDVSKACVY